MAITANTGSNNWNTNGAWVGGVQPTAADDVILPATAVVTIPTATTALGRSVTVAAGATLAFASTTAVLTLGDGTAGAANVALSFDASSTITLTGLGVINFVSTSSTQQTVTTNGKTMPTLNFSGAGSSYLLDALTTSSSTTVSHSAGTLNTNNATWNVGVFNGNSSTARTLTLGSSAINLLSGGTYWNTFTNTNLTITANTAVVTGSAAGTFSTASGQNFNGMSLAQTNSGAGVVSSSCTLANYTRTGTAAKTDTFTLTTGTLTCTGTVTLNGNSTNNRVLIQSGTIGTTSTINAATVSMSNVDFTDITGAGAGAWTGTSIGDALGNSGITFDSPITVYQKASSNWDNTSTWSLTSGGATGGRVPLPQDSVIFDASSTGTTAGNMPRLGKEVTFTGFTGTCNFNSNAVTIYGNLTLASGMTFGSTQAVTLSGRSSQTLTMVGKSFGGALTIAAFGGTYTLQDALTVTGTLSHNQGTLTTQNFTITCLNFYSTLSGGTNTRTVNPGTSTINLANTAAANIMTLAGTGLTWNGGSETWVISTTSTLNRALDPSGFKLGTLTYTLAGSTGLLGVTGTGYFDTINFSDVTNARTLRLTNGIILTVRNFNVQGTSGKLMSVVSSSAGNAASLSLVGTPQTVDYLSVQDITSYMPYKFYIGANSTSVSGNTGVTASALPTQPYIWNAASATANSTTVTATFAYSRTATAGNLLLAFVSGLTSSGTPTAPSGYSLVSPTPVSIAASVIGYFYSKTAVGGETAATFSSTQSTNWDITLFEVGNISSPALDVTDSNSASGVTSQSTGAGVSNVANPAIAFAGFGHNGATTGTIAYTNSFLHFNGFASTRSTLAVLPLTSVASRTTTKSWTTSRNTVAVLLVYGGGSGQELSLMMMGMGS